MSSTKSKRLEELRRSIMEQVGMAASEVGGLTYDEADEWWDVLSAAVQDGFQGAHVDGEGNRVPS